MNKSTSTTTRLAALDQFRGYTVAGMFAVNALGSFTAVPALLKHHQGWCSYADTIMPQFFFAVGMALRIVLSREAEEHGRSQALRRGARRGLLLLLIGFCWYHPSRDFNTWVELTTTHPGTTFRDLFLTNVFQALTHIGAATLWVLPVILCGVRARIAWALGSALLHLWLSHAFWFDTLREWRVIDGGPLGFLTWSLPVLTGSLVLDAVQAAQPGLMRRLVGIALVLMAGGYGIACATQGGNLASPPGVAAWHPRDLWTMSQQTGSVSYQLFSSGFSLAVFVFFLWWTGQRGHSWPLFSTLGKNALVAYLIHMTLLGCLEHVAPRDAPLWYALAISSLGFVMCWLAVRWCNARQLILRL